MDWSKNAKKASTRPNRKLCIPISQELEKVMGFFRNQNPDLDFTDTAIVMTFIEAGVRAYIEDMRKSQAAPAVAHNDSQDDVDA